MQYLVFLYISCYIVEIWITFWTVQMCTDELGSVRCPEVRGSPGERRRRRRGRSHSQHPHEAGPYSATYIHFYPCCVYTVGNLSRFLILKNLYSVQGRTVKKADFHPLLTFKNKSLVFSSFCFAYDFISERPNVFGYCRQFVAKKCGLDITYTCCGQENNRLGG